MTVGRYLHGDSPGEQRARQYDLTANSRRRASAKRGLGEWSVEPRDPLETSILSGDRDEYVDRSFWHDAVAAGVTFDESRVDGIWEEEGNEVWK